MPMIRSKRLRIVFILFFVLGAAVFSQDKQQRIEDKDKGLREEILAVYQSGGEQGLRDFFKEKGKEITGKFIVDFAEAGVKERKEEWLKACEIMAEEKKDEKTLAGVYLRIGQYYVKISDYTKAHNYFGMALPIFLKLDDYDGEGNLYLETGILYYHTGDNSKALEMYEKALKPFLISHNINGQGNVYLRKGVIYFFNGDNSKALDMYEKALFCFRKTKNPLGQGNVYFSKGRVYFYTGKQVEALEMYENALPFYKEADDTTGIGNYYLCMGDFYSYSQDYQKALDMYDKALSLLEKSNDFLSNGNIYQRKGNLFFGIGEYAKALEMYEKALILFEKTEDPMGQGVIYKYKAAINLIKGETSQALELYQKALIFFKKAEEPRGQGEVYQHMGELYLRTGDKLKALEMFKKALPFFWKAGDLTGQGEVLVDIGNFHVYKNENVKALNMFDKALIFFKKDSNIPHQGRVYFYKGTVYSLTGKHSMANNMFDKAQYIYEKSNNYLGQGSVCYEKGNIYLISLDFKKAFENYDKALQFYEKVGYVNGQGNVYWRKGDIYLRAGFNSKALEMYEKASQFLEKADDPIGQGNVILQKEEIYFRNGDFSKALYLCEKALIFHEKTGNKVGKGNVYLNMGEILRKIGEIPKALEMYGKAMLFYEKADDLTGQGNIYKVKGDIYLENCSYSKALEMLEKALLIYEKIQDNKYSAFTLHAKAKALEKQGKKNEAHNTFEKSISKLEIVRNLITFSEIKGPFMEMVCKQYEEVTQFMLRNKVYEKAFKYAEAMKARVFLDQMAEGLRSLEKGVKPELKEARDLLVGKLSALSRQIQETGVKDEKKLQELKEEYNKVESQFDDLLIKIRMENPLYAAVNYPQPISVQDLQKEVLKDNETLLSYFISQDEIYAFVISKNIFHVEPLKIKEKEVNSLVERYLLAIKGNNANDTKRYGGLLYEKLFKPLEKYLEKDSDIIIVPAGQLEKIPFESLIIDNKKPGPPVYLLGKYRLKYVQSATLLSILRKHYSGDSTAKGFIGFGDPVYDYENFKQGKPEQGSMEIFATKAPSHQELFYNNFFGVPLCLSAFVAVSKTTEKEEEVVDEIKEIHRDRFARAGGVMNRLPQSGEEIQAIAKLFEKESLATKIYLRDQAAEENARANNMKDFSYIHFSCHGLLNDDFQCLVLSQLPGSTEDGYFTLNEIMNCDYNAKLIVLSACQTGSGKMARGEGITGLTRAFMYAGSPAVVASLWDVDDAATKELMVKFYSNMLEKNLDKVEALRQAKLELLKGAYPSPLYWSAFVMYGE